MTVIVPNGVGQPVEANQAMVIFDEVDLMNIMSVLNGVDIIAEVAIVMEPIPGSDTTRIRLFAKKAGEQKLN